MIELILDIGLPIALTLLSLGLSIALVKAKQELKSLQTNLLIEQEVDEINRSRAAAEGFYDNVLEADITNNRLIGKNCMNLLQLLELPETAQFTECIDEIIQRFVKEPYRELYRDCFDREKLLKRFHSGEKNFTFEFEERADLLHFYWTRATICIYYSQTSQAVKLISYVKNIHAEKEKELQLLKEANTDYLTGLYNKRAAEHMISDFLEENRTGNFTHLNHALLIVDIDHFKEVNDTIGHAGGDKILCKTAALLQSEAGSDDVVSRIGGDEFLILLKNCKDAECALHTAGKLNQLASSIKADSPITIPISLSIGIALSPMQADRFTELFHLADKALYDVKRNGRNGCKIYEKLSF